METKNEATQSGSGKKWWLLLGAILIALIGGLIFSTPLILRVGLEKWLLANGADQVRISSVRFNPLAGSLSIRGVEIVRDGKKVVMDSEASLEIQLSDLIRKKAALNRVTLNGVVVDLEQYTDGTWRYGFYTPSPSAEEPSRQGGRQSPSSWILSAEEIILTDSQMHLKIPDLELTLKVDSLRLSGLSSAAGAKPAKLVFSGSVNDAPVALDLDSLQLLPHPSLSGTVDVRGFQLAWLADFLKPYLRPFTGAATVNGAVRFFLGPDTDLDVAYDGHITLEQGDLGGDSWGVRGKKIGYSGKARFQMPPRGAMVVDVDGRLQGNEVEVAVPAAELQIRQQNLLLTGPVQVSIGEEVRVDSGATVSAGKTDLTLPILALGDTTLSWKGDVSYNSGTATRNQQVSFNGALLVNEPAFALDTRTVALHTEGKKISYQGAGRYTSPLAKQADHTVALNGVLQGTGLRFTMPDHLDLAQQQLRLAGRTSVHFGGQTAAVQVDGELALEDGRQRILPLLTGAQKALNWKGTAHWQQDDHQQAVLLDGTLAGTGLNVLLHGRQRQLSLEDLSLATRTFDLRLKEQEVELHGSGDLRASQLLISHPGAGNEILKGRELTIAGLKAPDNGPITVSKVGLQGLEINGIPRRGLRLSLPSLELHSMMSQDLEHFTIEALRSGPLTLTDTMNESDQGGIGWLEGSNIHADTGGNVRLDRMRVENVHLLPWKESETLRLGSILISQPGWSMDQGLSTKEIVLRDLFMDLQIDHQGTVNLSRALRELTGSPDPAPDAAEKKKEAERAYSGPALQIESIRLEGKNRILFTDHRAATDYTRKHPFTMELVPTRALVEHIDSLDTEKPASYSLEALIDKFSYLSVEGTAQLFGPSLVLDQKVQLKNYPLVNLSPYAADAIGVEFTQGQLELQANIHIAHNTIDADNNFLFKKVDVQTVDKEKAKALPFDLDYALAILRDSNGNIELKVPVSGPIDKLDVGLSGLLITAMNKAVVTGASSYLIYALGPYAALAYLGAKVGNEILKTRLAPVEFAPGSAVLSEKQSDYLDRVAKILKDRPKLELQLCPKLGRDDLPRESKIEELSNDDKERLLDLGERRAIAVRDFLTEKYGIDPRRLLICSSAFDTGNGGKPRVDLQL
ncbi:DUF748 domain-containing protein [Desulfolithobacter sp.]